VRACVCVSIIDHSIFVYQQLPVYIYVIPDCIHIAELMSASASGQQRSSGNNSLVIPPVTLVTEDPDVYWTKMDLETSYSLAKPAPYSLHIVQRICSFWCDSDISILVTSFLETFLWRTRDIMWHTKYGNTFNNSVQCRNHDGIEWSATKDLIHKECTIYCWVGMLFYWTPYILS